jgi:hypothetical protein
MTLRVISCCLFLVLLFGKAGYATSESCNSSNVNGPMNVQEQPYRYMYAGLMHSLVSDLAEESTIEDSAKDMSLLVFYGSIWGLRDSVDVIGFKTENDYTNRIRESLRNGTGFVDQSIVLNTPYLERDDLSVRTTKNGWIQVFLSDHAIKRLPPDVVLYLLQEFYALNTSTVWMVTENGTLVLPFDSADAAGKYSSTIEQPDYTSFLRHD